MDQINISEQKPKRTKAFFGISMFILVFIFFGGLLLFQNTKIQKNDEVLKIVLSKPISLKESDRVSFPPYIINFIGAWEGSWDFGSDKKVPAALTVTDIVPDKGVNVCYGVEENTELGTSGDGKNVLGEIGTLREKENVIALALTLLQSENTEPMQLHFWFADSTSQTLLGEFINPQTEKTVQGTFSAVK